MGMTPTERLLKLRRQMAAAAGKKSTTSLASLMEAHGLEVEEELSTLPTEYWQKEFGPENGIMNKEKRGWGKFKKFRCGDR